MTMGRKSLIRGVVLYICLICLISCENTPSFASSNQHKNIRVAIYAEDLILSSGLDKFLKVFNTNEWMVGNITYHFVITQIYDSDIYRGYLSTKNYDILLMPGGGGGGHAILTKSNQHILWVKLWRKNMIDFITSGGGYFGVCGGTYFLLGLDRPPHTPYEQYLDRSALGVSSVKLSFDSYATPLLSQWIGLPPEKVSHVAYLYYTGWNASQPHRSGECLDIPINRSHPIFHQYLEETLHMRWISGPAYSIPAHPDRVISIAAWYPQEEISKNTSTQIHAWKYTGGFLGFLPGFFRYVYGNGTFPTGLTSVYAHAGDWKQLDTKITTNFSNKPFMTTEIYPNDYAARIVVCAGHPEFPVWWGGYIKESPDTRHNSLYDSLYQWTNVTPENQTIADEESFTWWLVRRAVAWTAKVPDTDLPPVYGPSQVNTIYPYEQSFQFTVQGNSEMQAGSISLELMYRYSSDNVTWGSWTSFGNDTDSSDGWQWEFNTSQVQGSGYYQFYSLRHVHTQNEWLNETAPPGPDASIHVN